MLRMSHVLLKAWLMSCIRPSGLFATIAHRHSKMSQDNSRVSNPPVATLAAMVS